MLLALASALAAMVSNTAATLLQAVGSRRATVRRPLWRQRPYLLGLALDALGWVLSVAALRVLPVIAVQSVLTSSVALTTLATHGFDPRRLLRRELVAVLGVIAGLVLVAGSASTDRPEDLSAAAVPVLVGMAVLVLVVAWPVARRARPLVVAGVAGCSYGGAALSVRALHLRYDDLTADLGLLEHPLVYAVAVFGLVGVALVAAALRHGSPGPVTAVLSVTEVLLPGGLGIVLLGDAVRPGWGPALAVGVVAVLTSVAALATAEGVRRQQPV